MGIHIGNNNKIKSSTIGNKVNIKNPEKNKTFSENHPYLTGIVISLIAGFILLFSFWKNIADFIERLF